MLRLDEGLHSEDPMSWTVGQTMIRVEDGMKGVVTLTEGDIARIAYMEHGEVRIAGKGEKWEPSQTVPRKLRREEMLLVGRYADAALRSLDRHEPMRLWEVGLEFTSRPTYDADLVDLIVDYLAGRT